LHTYFQNSIKKGLLISLACLWLCFLEAQTPSFIELMKQDSAMDVYLCLDWKELAKHKKEKAYQDASVAYMLKDQDPCTLKAKVRTRGHMRLDICSFPPLKLKIDKDELAAHHLSDWNEMDIVNHCFETEGHDQLLLKEYLAYKLWELVSPYHFRTQLIRLHYLNPDNTEAHDNAYAFLVENPEELCNRLGSRRIKTKVISQMAIEKIPFLRACLFEFMIGNTDWYIPTRHNLEFVGVEGYKLLVPIPYDFDYSGMVNAPYAVANENLHLSSVVVRFYQGWCHTTEEVNEELKVFHEQKQNILGMPYRIEGLDEKSIRQCVAYLQDFYDIIENPKKLENQIVKHCGMWPPAN
jgi:hypothetical protein